MSAFHPDKRPISIYNGGEMRRKACRTIPPMFDINPIGMQNVTEIRAKWKARRERRARLAIRGDNNNLML